MAQKTSNKGRPRLAPNQRKSRELRASCTEAAFRAAENKARKYRISVAELIRDAVRAY